MSFNVSRRSPPHLHPFRQSTCVKLKLCAIGIEKIYRPTATTFNRTPHNRNIGCSENLHRRTKLVGLYVERHMVDPDLLSLWRKFWSLLETDPCRSPLKIGILAAVVNQPHTEDFNVKPKGFF